MLGLVSALYALFGVVFVAAYVPQLLAVWHSQNGAADVSLGTWGGVSVASSDSIPRDDPHWAQNLA